MKKSLLSLIFLLSVFVTHSLTAEVNFLSPVSGVWGNKQMLMIENVEEGEYFYSVNGSNPEESGFAYDGPVFLDIEGDVVINVTHVDKSGKKDYGTVSYSVIPDKGNEKDSSFFDLFYNTGFYDYVGNESLNIPMDLYYSLDSNPVDFIQGQSLSISEKSVLSRYIPCTVLDKTKNVKWRFIIKINQQTYGLFSKRDVPFTITDWETITFKNDNLIYKIDSEYWSLPTEPLKLDRTISHMISWQSIDYKLGNIVEYFVLPPKPGIYSVENDDGSVSFCIDGDSSYRLSIISENSLASPELFSELCLDVFYGESLADDLTLGIYSDSIYQGQLDVSFEVDKKPPVSPVITSSAKTFYSRNSVDLEIKSEEDSQLFIAVSDPYIIENTKDVYGENNPEFCSVIADNYVNCENSYKKITLDVIDQKIAYYKVSAYSQKGNIKSNVSEYSVIVDQSSYYYNAGAKDSLAEGTLLNPFTSFEQCVEAFEDSRSVTVRLTGDLYIDKKYEIYSNLKIINNGDARVIFGPEGSLEILGSSLEIQDCRIHKISSPKVSLIVPFFKLNRGTLDLTNCQLSGEFRVNGTIIDSIHSIITVKDSIISITADSYSSFISSIDSRLAIDNSYISVTGDTCVIISASKGNVSIYNSKFKVIGKIGRIAELFDVDAEFMSNEYKAVLDKTAKTVSPIFVDKKTTLIEKDNIQIGF